MKLRRICATLSLTAMIVTLVGQTEVKAGILGQNVKVESKVNEFAALSNWTKNTKYNVGDKVIYKGNVYECTVDHSKLVPTTKYVWKFVEEVTFEVWTTNTKYTVGQKVSYNGNIYECTVGHSKLVPTTKYVWKQIVL